MFETEAAMETAIGDALHVILEKALRWETIRVGGSL